MTAMERIRMLESANELLKAEAVELRSEVRRLKNVEVLLEQSRRETTAQTSSSDRLLARYEQLKDEVEFLRGALTLAVKPGTERCQ